MFLEGLLDSVLVELTKKNEAHPYNMFLNPLAIFEEPLVSKTFEEKGMDSVAFPKIIPGVFVSIAFCFKFLSNALHFVWIAFQSCPLDSLTFHDLMNLKAFLIILFGNSWNKR